jgi:hypothetical protein
MQESFLAIGYVKEAEKQSKILITMLVVIMLEMAITIPNGIGVFDTMYGC